MMDIQENYHNEECTQLISIADKIDSIIKDRVIFGIKGERTAVTLWIIGTYLMDYWQLWPKLYICSPERECGKTTLLSIIEGLVKSGVMASAITPASLYRIIETDKPTICIDEADSFLNQNEEMNGLLNAGHMRRTAVKILSVPSSHGSWETKKFSLWGAQAIAGIGDQKDTLMSRSIKINLRRKFLDEKVLDVPFDFFDWCAPIRDELDNLSTKLGEKIFKSTVSITQKASDRTIDNWLPIFKITNFLDATWRGKVNEAFLAIEVEKYEDDNLSVGLQILKDVHYIIKNFEEVEIQSTKLLAELTQLPDSDWGSYFYGKPISSRWLANRLRPYGIRPIKQMYYNVYKISDFKDVIKRYLPYFHMTA